MLAEQASERVDSVLDDPEVDPVVTRRLGASSGLWVPLVARGRGIGVLAAHDKEGVPDAASPTTTFASPRPSPAVPPSRSTSPSAWRAMLCGASWRRRSSSGAGWRASCTTRRGRRSRRSCSALRGLEGLPDPARAHEALVEIRELALATLRDVRKLAVDLHPKTLDDFGLVSALERLLETWREQTGIAVELADRLGGEELLPEAATALYRIVQEALTNVVKHAAARHVSILLTYKNGRVVAVIEDDGQGFDPDAESMGSGIESMRERVRLLDGRFRIESSPNGSGTTLVVEVPLT